MTDNPEVHARFVACLNPSMASCDQAMGPIGDARGGIESSRGLVNVFSEVVLSVPFEPVFPDHFSWPPHASYGTADARLPGGPCSR